MNKAAPIKLVKDLSAGEFAEMLQDRQGRNFAAETICADCRHWFITDVQPDSAADCARAARGVCRLNPPDAEGRAVVTAFDYWCGQGSYRLHLLELPHWPIKCSSCLFYKTTALSAPDLQGYCYLNPPSVSTGNAPIVTCDRVACRKGIDRKEHYSGKDRELSKGAGCE